MTDLMQRDAHMLSLLQQALDRCTSLQRFSDENFEVFCGEDEEKILAFILERDDILNRLNDLEDEIESLRDEMQKFPPSEDTAEKMNSLQKSIQSVLGLVSARDLEAMELVSTKMQKYKNETIKARNKKQVSAYILSGFSKQPGQSIDCKK